MAIPLKVHQHALFDRKGHSGARLTTLSYDYADKDRVPEHFHDTDQLVFASRGVMTIRTEEGFWVVPPQRGVWIPSAMEAGYNSPSAFIVRFKKLLGCTPSRYFDRDASA